MSPVERTSLGGSFSVKRNLTYDQPHFITEGIFNNDDFLNLNESMSKSRFVLELFSAIVAMNGRHNHCSATGDDTAIMYVCIVTRRLKKLIAFCTQFAI